MLSDEVRARQHVYWGNMVFLWHPAKEPKMDQPFRSYYNLDLLSLANTKYLISPVPLDDPDLVLLPSPDRNDFIKWDARKSTSRAIASLTGEWSHRPIYIYENRRCLPRYFLARSVVLYDDPNTLVYDLRRRTVDELRETVVVDCDDVPAGIDLEPLTTDELDTCHDSIGEVNLAARSADRIELEFSAAQPCVLFLSNTYHPSWHAALDGEKTPIFPVDHAFQGIYVPAPGKHRVVLTYEPDYALLK
jgi:hypothetical protein